MAMSKIIYLRSNTSYLELSPSTVKRSPKNYLFFLSVCRWCRIVTRMKWLNRTIQIVIQPMLLAWKSRWPVSPIKTYLPWLGRQKLSFVSFARAVVAVRKNITGLLVLTLSYILQMNKILYHISYYQHRCNWKK